MFPDVSGGDTDFPVEVFRLCLGGPARLFGLELPPDIEEGEHGLWYPFELLMSIICPEDEEGLGLTHVD